MSSSQNGCKNSAICTEIICIVVSTPVRFDLRILMSAIACIVLLYTSESPFSPAATSTSHLRPPHRHPTYALPVYIPLAPFPMVDGPVLEPGSPSATIEMTDGATVFGLISGVFGVLGFFSFIGGLFPSAKMQQVANECRDMVDILDYALDDGALTETDVSQWKERIRRSVLKVGNPFLYRLTSILT